MAEPFKNQIDVRAVQRLAEAADLPASFEQAATNGLDALELKDRVRHIARVLRAHLPADWPRALERLDRALPPERESTDDLVGGFVWWPVVHVVGEHGLAHPEASLAFLRRATSVFTAEFAMRPFLRDHPTLAWATARRWAAHDNVHVRRLASEGTRPRLPWGLRLPSDPARSIPLLALLRDDRSEYVRRSVANHLNDLSKDHPDAVVHTARAWMTADRRRLIRHALRTLVKAGDAGALDVLGFVPVVVEASLEVTAAIAVGDDLDVRATLHSAVPADVVVDLRLVRQTARGTGRLVFKWTTRSLPAGETVLTRKLPIRVVTTRVWYPGEHVLELLVNGTVAASATFELEVPDPG